MTKFSHFSRRGLLKTLAAGALAGVIPLKAGAFALDGFAQGVAESIGGDPALSAFYRGRNFSAFWTAEAGQSQLENFLSALLEAPVHGLPQGRFDPRAILNTLGAVQTAYDLGQAEVQISRVFLAYAQALHGGFLAPARVVSAIKRQPQQIDGAAALEALSRRPVQAVLRAQQVQTAQYARLMAERGTLLQLQAGGGWGPRVEGQKFRVGESGARVTALRERMILQGFMAPSISTTYDEALIGAVRRFQAAHGLEVDGIAGAGTLAELNVPLEERLHQILVALERSRWANAPEADRYVWVNLTDYSTVIMQDGEEAFRTRSVIGSLDESRQTPEFSEIMRFAVVNPSWTVPRSIVTKEYLPQLQRNRNAVSGIDVIDSRGRVVDRSAIDFAAYTERSFPFGMRQPPSPRNSLGLYKYMFPNPWNIYLHDTPSKDLFNRETRAFSHGCVRLQEPLEFGKALFAPEVADPASLLRRSLDTGRETRVNLEQPIPIHIDYRTAFISPAGTLQFRRDVYGRDAQIWRAMQAAGVEIGIA